MIPFGVANIIVTTLDVFSLMGTNINANPCSNVTSTGGNGGIGGSGGNLQTSVECTTNLCRMYQFFGLGLGCSAEQSVKAIKPGKYVSITSSLVFNLLATSYSFWGMGNQSLNKDSIFWMSLHTLL